MALTFEWDENKAKENEDKHGISFEEAKTIFNDPLSMTTYDPDHSEDEDRFIDMGRSITGKILVVSYTERGENIRLISSREATRREQKDYEGEEEKNSENTEMRAEYDFSDGVRGKHVKAYRQGHKVKINKLDGSTEEHYFTQEDGAVMLDPDVKQHFPDSESVNRALRSLIVNR